MKKLLFLLLVLCLQFAVLLDLHAWGKVDAQKNMQFTYNCPSDVQIHIQNKYGTIEFVRGNSDSVRVEIVVKASGNSKSDAESVLERVDVIQSYFTGSLEMETIFDKEANSITSLVRSVLDFSTKIIDGGNIQVHYKVFAPEKARIHLQNKFGDIKLWTSFPKAVISQAHGNFYTEETGSYFEIDHSFGKIQIQKVTSAKIKAKFSDLTLLSAHSLMLDSRSSDIMIEECKQLTLDSGNDKIQLEEVGQLNGSSTFTTLQIQKISEKVRIQTQFGSLRVHEFLSSFTEADIDSKATQIMLRTNENSSMKFDVSVKARNFSYPSYVKISEQVYSDPKEKYEHYKASIGNPTQSSPTIKIQSSSGQVQLGF